MQNDPTKHNTILTNYKTIHDHATYNTMQDKTMQYDTMQCNAIRYKTGYDNANQYNTVQSNARQDSAVQYEVQYGRVRYKTLQRRLGAGSASQAGLGQGLP